jgi:hypothetical protein
MPTLPDDDDHVNDQLFSIDEAADFLRSSIDTLRDWRHRGIGPKSFKVGRRVRYWRSELIRWLAEQAQQPAPAIHNPPAPE